MTIKEYDPRFKLYKLEFPNEEVRYGFLNFITPFIHLYLMRKEAYAEKLEAKCEERLGASFMSNPIRM